MPMPDIKLMGLLDKILSGTHDPVSAIVENEQGRGFKVIRPGDAPWFRATEWRAASVASLNGQQVRLVLIHAFESGRGALTRTLAAIRTSGLNPVIIDPTRELAAALRRRGWKSHVVGSNFDDRETVWKPRD